MKRFVIKNPIPGRSTAAIVTHEYNKSTQRTQSIYLGCISIDMDPARLNNVEVINAGETFSGVKLRPGMLAAGSEFRLEPEDIRTVQAWLIRNGTFVKEVEAQEAAIAAEKRAAAWSSLVKSKRLCAFGWRTNGVPNSRLSGPLLQTPRLIEPRKPSVKLASR